jgi:hypothetical protein
MTIGNAELRTLVCYRATNNSLIISSEHIDRKAALEYLDSNAKRFQENAKFYVIDVFTVFLNERHLLQNESADMGNRQKSNGVKE